MRVARRLLHVLLLVLTLIVGATAAAIIVSQTAWFKNRVRGYIVSEANKYLNGQLSIERLGGNLFFGVELENIGVTMDGSEVVAVQDLGLDYNVFELITKGLSVDNIRLNEPDLPAPRWRHVVDCSAGQEAGTGSEPAGPAVSDHDRRHRHQRRIDRHRRPGRHLGRQGPERIDRIDAKLVVRVRAGTLFDRDLRTSRSARSIPNSRSTRFRRRRGEATTRCSSTSSPMRTAGDVALGRRCDPTVSVDAGAEPARHVRQDIASGDRPRRSGACGDRAAAGIRVQAERAARSARRRHERALVGRPADRNARRRCAGTRTGRARRRLRSAPGSGAAPQGSIPARATSRRIVHAISRRFASRISTRFAAVPRCGRRVLPRPATAQRTSRPMLPVAGPTCDT